MPVTASTSLLISQWSGAPRLKAVLDIWLAVLQEQIVGPLEQLRLYALIDSAEGVWLDYIGERLGIARPWDTRRTDDRFGFDMAGLGFDQGRFSNEPSLEARAPIADLLYRRLIKARAVTVLTYGKTSDMQKAVEYVDPSAVVTDLHDMTFRVTTGRRRDIELADRARAFPKPAGVRMIVADAGRFGYDQAGAGFDQGPFGS